MQSDDDGVHIKVGFESNTFAFGLMHSVHQNVIILEQVRDEVTSTGLVFQVVVDSSEDGVAKAEEVVSGG